MTVIVVWLLKIPGLQLLGGALLVLGLLGRFAGVEGVPAGFERTDVLIVMAVLAIVELVEERRRHWQLLQFLAGQSEAVLTAQHRTELEALTSRYAEAVDARAQRRGLALEPGNGGVGLALGAEADRAGAFELGDLHRTGRRSGIDLHAGRVHRCGPRSS